ncbi:3'(2'),5'-bisphosphate nucleotidase CysQ family protein [Campylobacter sputorum]|uniref:3'(2'),5'-bisphosphate nucleotidase CysQ family protein n=1 Tax=Campylobacter sputorum TaxID=206 RepID=UPI00053BF142|nr:inositol monophosphatase family protein [Campylobacter sputorum]
MKSELNLAIKAAKLASQKIMWYRQNGFSKYKKTDGSIVTDADIAANEIIVKILEQTGIDICSEEIDNTDKNSDTFWLIDPLDGTSHFVKGENEFCILITLIKNNRPILGVIYLPMYDNFMSCDGKEVYINDENLNKFRVDISPNIMLLGSQKERITTIKQDIIEKFKTEIIHIGSGIKFYKLALGNAGMFLRNRISHSWDIAAGDLMVNASGGIMVNSKTGELLKYNAPKLKNEPYIALSRENAHNIEHFLKILKTI